MKLRALVPVLVLVSFASAACRPPTANVAPPAAPDRAMPDVTTAEPSGDSGLARVVITTDVPARVEADASVHVDVSRRSGNGIARTLLCASTPCTLTLPFGDHELVLIGTRDEERMSGVTVHVARSTVVMNHTLGRVHHAQGQQAATGLMVIGVLGLLIGLGIAGAAAKSRESSSKDVATAAVAIGGFGLGILVVGGIVMAASPTEKQDGATSQWSPPPATAAGASIGVRF